jgi:hypothetical protein
MRAPAIVLLTALLIALCAVPSAHAATCGVKDARTGTIPVGQLTLNSASRTDVVYQRSTKPRSILLVFDVKGCTLEPGHQPDPDVAVTPTNSPGEDLPADALAGPAVALRGGREVEYAFPIDLGHLTPGSYFGAIEMRSAYLKTARTPVSVSRSESKWWIPVLYGAAGGLAGIMWFVIVSLASSALPDRSWWIGLIIGLGVVFGAIGGYLSWRNQEVWTAADNAWATIGAGFTGATTGALAALTAQLVKKHSDDATDAKDALARAR